MEYCTVHRLAILQLLVEIMKFAELVLNGRLTLQSSNEYLQVFFIDSKVQRPKSTPMKAIEQQHVRKGEVICFFMIIEVKRSKYGI